MRRFLKLLSVLTATGGRALTERAATLYVSIAVVSGIVFGGNGMHPRHVTRGAAAHLGLRAALWALWLILTTPAARAILVAPSTFALRALPVPRAWLAFVPMALLVGAEGPWLILWGVGDGALAGISCGVAAAAAHALIVARSQRAGALAATGALLFAVLWPARGVVLAGVAIAAFLVGGWEVFRAAPEQSYRAGQRLPRGPIAATAAALLVGVGRAEGAVLVRAGVLTALGAAAAALGIINNHVTRAATVSAVSLAVATPLATGATAGIAGAVLRAERRLRWVLDACGATAGLRVVAASAATMVCGVGAGAVHGALVGVAAGVGAPVYGRLVAGGAALGGVLGLATTSIARLAGNGPSASERLFSGAAAFALFACVATALSAEAGAAIAAAAALGLAWIAGVRASRESLNGRAVQRGDVRWSSGSTR